MVRPRDVTVMQDDPWMGGVWIATKSVGLFFKPYQGAPQSWGAVTGIHTNSIDGIHVTPQYVWVASAAGPTRLDKSSATWERVTEGGQPWDIESVAVHADGKGGAWFGTEDGLWRVGVDLKARRVDPLEWDEPFPVLGVDVRGTEVFYTVFTKGLARWDTATGQATVYNNTIIHGEPTYGRVVVQGNDAWVGSALDGAIRYDLTTGKSKHYASPYNTNSPNIREIHIHGTEAWFAGEGGVSRFDMAAGYWQSYHPTSGMQWGSDPRSVVFAQGEVYAATVLGDIYHYDRATDSWESARWWTAAFYPWGNNIRDCDVAEIGDKTVLLASGVGATTTKFHFDTGWWIRWGAVPEDHGQPPDLSVYDVEWHDGEAWFASTLGIGHWHPDNGWTRYRTDGLTHPERRVNLVVDVAVHDDFVAAATPGYPSRDGWQHGHLGILDKASGQWTFYGADDGLESTNVTRVAIHGDDVWLATGLGVRVLRDGVLSDNLLGGADVVLSLHVHNDVVYAGTVFGGLLRFEDDEPIPEPGFSNRPVESMATINGRIVGGWEDTSDGARQYGGAFRWTPGQEPEPLLFDGPHQPSVRCAAFHDDTWYFGSDWGIQRYRDGVGWLFQDARAASGPAGITITAPTGLVDSGPITIAGTANGPAGSRVVVWDGEAWSPAQGVATWETEVEVDTSTRFVTARILQDGLVLAQAVRDLSVRGAPPGDTDDDGISSAGVRFSPVLSMQAGQPLRLTAMTPESTGWRLDLLLAAPGGERTTHAFESVGEGTWNVTSPPLTLGAWAYQVHAHTPDGALVRLPDAYGPYGAWYPLTVKERLGATGVHVAFPDSEQRVRQGDNVKVPVTIQNIGSHDTPVTLDLGGAAQEWLQHPEGILVTAGASQSIHLDITVPRDAAVRPHDLVVTAWPVGQPEEASVATLVLRVAREGTSIGDDDAGPGEAGGATPLGAVVGLGALLAAAAIAQRRRS